MGFQRSPLQKLVIVSFTVTFIVLYNLYIRLHIFALKQNKLKTGNKASWKFFLIFSSIVLQQI